MENAFYFEEFMVTADRLQYIVKERKTVKESKYPDKVGTVKWENEKFYPSLQGVFNVECMAKRTV